MSEPDYDARAEVEWADYLSGEEISELAAEVAELTEALRCAERYRWLRENVGYVIDGGDYAVRGLAMDLAIDAAMEGR